MEETKLIGLLKDLESDAQLLQRCLLARDTEQINSALLKQEESLELLDAYCRTNAGGIRQLVQENGIVRELLKNSKKIVLTNRALTKRFLDVVDQTLSRLGSKNTTTYGHYGSSTGRSPVLVRQQG